MNILTQLSGLALRGAARAACEAAGVGAAAVGVEGVVGLLERRFVDRSAKLTRALQRASSKTWRAVEIALAGNSWWDRCKLTLASADERALRQQVQAYLDAHPLDGIDGHGPNFRLQSLAQLQAARKAGLLDRDTVDPGELAKRVGDLSRFGDQTAAIEAEYAALQEIATNLRRQGYEALATFLTLRPASGPPLLLSAMRFFLQGEIEMDRQLFQGLAHARLESLAEDQRAGFTGLAETLDRHAERLDGLLENVQAVVVQTHADVLDIKAELVRQSQQMQELGQAVLRALDQHHLARRELHAGDSLSVRDEEERRLVRDLVKRYRALPPEQRKQMPALLNAVGKLEVVTGDYESAQRDFRQLAALVPDSAARAEAAHNAYHAALERRAWSEALASLREAAQLDPMRFALFPTDKFEPERILGAGGFGVAFLCRNRHSGGRVVIKTLRREGLDRDLSEVFREAQTLEELEHPAIIRIRDCDYADTAHTRPYFVMDYFPGQTLAEHVEQYGPLTTNHVLSVARLMAGGLQRAHSREILHRDVKPANVLVRRDGGSWTVKLIDFGLALRAKPGSSTMRSSTDRTLASSSIAGTLEYAAPEQMGKLKGVAVGTYSDVYGFGKTCCFALFGTPQPTFQHWQKLPAPLAELLGRCLSEQPRERPADFTAVLRELDRLTIPEAVLLEAEPVEDLPEVEPVRPAPARPRPSRQRRHREEEDQAPPPPRRSRTGLMVVGLLLCMGVVGMTMLVSLFHRGGEGISVPWPGSSFTRGEPPVEPISEEDFPKVLAELEQKPALPRLGELARRLAVTEPTPKQKQKHDKVKALLASGGKGLGFETELKAAEKDDEILRVSRALNPLLTDPDRWKGFKNKKLGADAAQKWGTSENVVPLIDVVGGHEGGVLNLRLSAAKALAKIGDPRGIAPVVARLDDIWDRHHNVAAAIIDFGPAAEDEVLKKLTPSTNTFVLDEALKVIKAIGTQKSLPALEKLATDWPRKGAAQQAIQVINARVNSRP